jgi:PelA/Pel-15E family pectate lyase
MLKWNWFKKISLALALLHGSAALAPAAQTRQSGPVLARALDQNDDWFASPVGRQFMSNIVAWQNRNGGWWKEYDPDTTRPADKADTATSTIDNGATCTEMRLLARAQRVNAADGQLCRDSFTRGLKFLLDSQYPNGGWPQRFPLEDNYGRHITFNDNAMVNVMRVLDNVAAGRAPDYTFVSGADRTRARESFDRGVNCILKCQIRSPRDGKLTAWCQQHDEVTFAPARARSYELPSIGAAESSDIVLVLMSIGKPSKQVIDSIEAAVAWLDATKIVGKRYARQVDDSGKTTDWPVKDDPSAPPLWARYYDIDTNQPFFANRDGVKTSSYDQVAKERRTGYRWYGTWGNRVLAEYPKWKATHVAATQPRTDGRR